MRPAVQLACMTWPYKDHPLERALEGIAAAGYRYVSLGLPHEGKPVFQDESPGDSERILQLLDRYELKPAAIISTEAFSLKQPIERAWRRMDFAHALGVQELLSLGTTSYRRFPEEPVPTQEMKLMNEAFAHKFRVIGEEAGKRGLVVSIKPHTGNTATAAILAETLRTIGSPYIKASYDPGNVHFYEGLDAADDLPQIAADTISFVAKDHRGERAEEDFPVPGEGDVRFRPMFAALRAAGFAGTVLVERLDGKGGPASAAQWDQRIAKARSNLQQMLAEAGFDC